MKSNHHHFSILLTAMNRMVTDSYLIWKFTGITKTWNLIITTFQYCSLLWIPWWLLAIWYENSLVYNEIYFSLLVHDFVYDLFNLADLVFFQNGMLEPWLQSKGLSDADQVLAYFAVSKLGEPPIDGKTDTNPEGLTAAYGKWASAVAGRLHAGGLSCKVKNLFFWLVLLFFVKTAHQQSLELQFCVNPSRCLGAFWAVILRQLYFLKHIILLIGKENFVKKKNINY